MMQAGERGGREEARTMMQNSLSLKRITGRSEIDKDNVCAISLCVCGMCAAFLTQIFSACNVTVGFGA